MTRLTLAAGWAFLIALSLFIAIVYSGCGSISTPAVAKPEPKKQTEAIPLVCLQVFRQDRAPVLLCGSKQMCDYAHSRIVSYWDNLQTRYGAEALSDCTDVTAVLTER